MSISKAQIQTLPFINPQPRPLGVHFSFLTYNPSSLPCHSPLSSLTLIGNHTVQIKTLHIFFLSLSHMMRITGNSHTILNSFSFFLPLSFLWLNIILPNMDKNVNFSPVKIYLPCLSSGGTRK